MTRVKKRSSSTAVQGSDFYRIEITLVRSPWMNGLTTSKIFQVRKHIRPFLVLLFTEAALSIGFEIQYSDEYGLFEKPRRLFPHTVLNIVNIK